MIKTFFTTVLLFCFAAVSAQNTFPAAGNVGIGTLSPAGNLDVYNAYFSHGYKFLDNVMTNNSIGFFNPFALAVRQGKKLYLDEEFAEGSNSVTAYDNNHTGLVTISRCDTIADLPNSSGYGLIITHNGAGESPGLGGFVQIIHAGMNKTFIQLFRAKLPAGYRFVAVGNSTGTGGTNYWLSNSTGTGKWEWYIRVVQCGNGGTFSSAGHVYVTGSPTPTAASPLIWYIASCTAFDITDVNGYNGDYVLNQHTSDQDASLRISGEGIIGGNVLIGKATQTNPAYKLDVNGNIRANKVVVNTTGADYVLDSLDGYIRKYHHLPGVLPAGQMQREGLDVGDNQAILLQKIEELTLYVIRQNKFILEQQIAMKKLSTEVAALKKTSRTGR